MPSPSTSTTSKTIPFSFCEVVASVLHRYPNPFASHIQSVDYLQPLTINNDGQLTCQTLNLKHNSLPSFMNKFSKDIGITRFNDIEQKTRKCISIIEEFKIDLTTHEMQHLSWNFDSRNILRTHELVTYKKPVLVNSDILAGQNSLASKKYYDRVAQITGSQCEVQKDLAVYSNFGFLASPIQKFALNRWQKNERKATHGLCFSVANQIYNKELAKEFKYAGLNDTALKNLQAKLSGYREKLYHHRDLFNESTLISKSKEKITHYREIKDLNLSKLSDFSTELQSDMKLVTDFSKHTKDKIKRDISKSIRNPKFQLMLLENVVRKAPK